MEAQVVSFWKRAPQLSITVDFGGAKFTATGRAEDVINVYAMFVVHLTATEPAYLKCAAEAVALPMFRNTTAAGSC